MSGRRGEVKVKNSGREGDESWRLLGVNDIQGLREKLAGNVSTEGLGKAGSLRGFLDPANIVETWDKANRTVTLTHPSGSIEYMWNGIVRNLPSPWTSSAYTNTNGSWFLSTSDGSNFTWANTPWDFKYVMAAYVIHPLFSIRECHGIMDPDTHEEFHTVQGTYFKSGGALTPGTYTLGGTATNAGNTPGVESAVVKDEDLPSTITALAQGTYMCASPNGSSLLDLVSRSFPFAKTGTYIDWYNGTTKTEGATNKFYNVYGIFVPTMADVDSLAYRILWLQPQAQHNTLAAAQAEDARFLSLYDLTSLATEFVPRIKLTYSSSAAYSTTGKVRLDEVTYISFTKAQVGQIAPAPVTGAYLPLGAGPSFPLTGDLFLDDGTITPKNVQVGNLTTNYCLVQSQNGFTHHQIADNTSSNTNSFQTQFTDEDTGVWVSFSGYGGIPSIKSSEFCPVNGVLIPLRTCDGETMATEEWVKAGLTFDGKVILTASSAATAKFNIGAFGVTVTSPVDGDIWKSAADSLAVRMNTNTRTISFLEKSQTWGGTQTFGTLTSTGVVTNRSNVTTQQSNTPTGTTYTWTLTTGNSLTLTLTSSTGNTTVTTASPTAGAQSFLSVVGHASATRDLTITQSGVTFVMTGKTSGSSITLDTIPINGRALYALYWQSATVCHITRRTLV